jgi:hypothetical protein
VKYRRQQIWTPKIRFPGACKTWTVQGNTQLISAAEASGQGTFRGIAAHLSRNRHMFQRAIWEVRSLTEYLQENLACDAPGGT